MIYITVEDLFSLCQDLCVSHSHDVIQCFLIHFNRWNQPDKGLRKLGKPEEDGRLNAKDEEGVEAETSSLQRHGHLCTLTACKRRQKYTWWRWGLGQKSKLTRNPRTRHMLVQLLWRQYSPSVVLVELISENAQSTLHNHLWPCSRLCQSSFPECSPIVHSFPRHPLALGCSSLYFVLSLWLKKKLEIDFYILGRGDRHVTVWTQNAPGSWDAVSYWFCQFAPLSPTVLRSEMASWVDERTAWLNACSQYHRWHFGLETKLTSATHNDSESVQLQSKLESREINEETYYFAADRIELSNQLPKSAARSPWQLAWVDITALAPWNRSKDWVWVGHKSTRGQTRTDHLRSTATVRLSRWRRQLCQPVTWFDWWQWSQYRVQLHFFLWCSSSINWFCLNKWNHAYSSEIANEEKGSDRRRAFHAQIQVHFLSGTFCNLHLKGPLMNQQTLPIT